jgi:hypothetical protein
MLLFQLQAIDMDEKKIIALLVHYMLLAGAIYLAFGWLMTTSEYQFTSLQLFIILLIVIVVVDMMLHKIMGID